MYLKVIIVFAAYVICCNNSFCQSELFTSNGSVRTNQTDIQILKPNQDEIQRLATSRDDKFNIQIPIGPKGMKTISLERSSMFDGGTTFVERHQKGSTIIQDLDISHYTGKVIGSRNSVVSLSIYHDELLGLISFDNQNWNLRKKKLSANYELFNDDKIVRSANIKVCESPEQDIFSEPINPPSLHNHKSSSAISTVDVYIECDYQMFTDFGSDVTNTLNYATSLLNTVNVIFNNANINLNITQIDVWSTPDPYDANNADSSGDVLNAFKCELDGVYNGRIAHLLSTTNQFGGIANRRDYCPYDEPLYAFSRIFTSFNNDLNVYTWSVNVVAHEIGHNLSSPHTHNCAWNGNNSQIDDCANVHATSNNNDSDCDGVIDNVEEASGSDCFDIANPIIPNKGTIMSYCHSSSGNGVDLSLGFHPQVATKMKDYIDNCLSPTTTIFCPIPHASDLSVSYSDPGVLVLSCSLTAGIDGYAWYIKEDRSCTSDTTIVTTDNTIIYGPINFNTDYVVKCLLNCDAGPEWGEWSCEVNVATAACVMTKNISGIQSDVVKFEKAVEIYSTEDIQDSSFITYYYGNETVLQSGFEVQQASVLAVLLTSCP